MLEWPAGLLPVPLDLLESSIEGPHFASFRYSAEWERIVKRTGRWIDFENDYKTLNPSFMESVWWVFKSLYAKGLVYRGFKVRARVLAINACAFKPRLQLPIIINLAGHALLNGMQHTAV